MRIRRQVQLLNGRLYFTLPKVGKTRVVDMPPSVAAALAQYFMEYPAVEVALPYVWWRRRDEHEPRFRRAGSPTGRWRYRPVRGTSGQARFLVKNSSSLSKGMRSLRSYRSTWSAPGTITRSTVSGAIAWTSLE